MPTIDTIPHDLAHWRDAHRLTRHQLAAAIGVTTRTVAGWERGHRPPPYLDRVLRDIAVELDEIEQRQEAT